MYWVWLGTVHVTDVVGMTMCIRVCVSFSFSLLCGVGTVVRLLFLIVQVSSVHRGAQSKDGLLAVVKMDC